MEIAVVPLRRVRGPGTLDAAGDGIATDAAPGLVEPAQALILGAGGFRVGAEQGRIAIAIALAF